MDRMISSHPDTLTAINNLARILRAQGELAASRSLREKLFNTCSRVFGEQHPHTLSLAQSLLGVYLEQEDWPACIELLGDPILQRFLDGDSDNAPEELRSIRLEAVWCRCGYSI